MKEKKTKVNLETSITKDFTDQTKYVELSESIHISENSANFIFL